MNRVGRETNPAKYRHEIDILSPPSASDTILLGAFTNGEFS
jgi:hypothetical protein